MNTVNPPGNEEQIARFLGDLLLENGFDVDYVSYGENRMHLIAKNNFADRNIPVLFSGHMDTVPLGVQKWIKDPFAGEIQEDKLYGRGSSDMKGGLAAMVIAAIEAVIQNTEAAVCLVFTSGEETGCQGAKHLMEKYKKFGQVKGIIIGEPTSNIPAVGHKGGMYLNVVTTGKTAHSSMPHLGENAIYKAARAVLRAEKFIFNEKEDSLLGKSTLNVGKFRGGINLNSVPDHAEFTVDARTTTHTSHKNLLEELKEHMGEEVEIETWVDLPAVATSESDSFVQLVYSACGNNHKNEDNPKSMPYLTDGAVLQPAFNGAPTIILGPGQPEMAHKTDEFCYIRKIEEAVNIYKNIILKGEMRNE